MTIPVVDAAQVSLGWRGDDESRRMNSCRRVMEAEYRERKAGGTDGRRRAVVAAGGRGALGQRAADTEGRLGGGRRAAETEGRLGGRRAAGVLMMVADLFGAARLFSL